jgi:hypothetical protein
VVGPDRLLRRLSGTESRRKTEGSTQQNKRLDGTSQARLWKLYIPTLTPHTTRTRLHTHPTAARIQTLLVSVGDTHPDRSCMLVVGARACCVLRRAATCAGISDGDVGEKKENSGRFVVA